jgi:hypothetical protein
LIPHLIRLLDTAAAVEAMRALSAVAAHRTGALIDALLDVRQPPAVRRRIARVMSGCRTRQAVDGMLLACDDSDATIRRHCARSLRLVHRRHPEIEMPADRPGGLSICAARALVHEVLPSST